MCEVAISESLAALLRAHRGLKHLKGGYVSVDDQGAMLTRDSMKHVVPRACRKAELREIQWHALRHSYASQLVMAGVPLKAVQELLGHADIQMTMRYAHLSPSVHREAVALLDRPPPLFGQQLGSDTDGKL